MLDQTPQLWFAAITTPTGPATTRRQALAALVANGIRGQNILEEEQPELGLWLVALPPAMTEGWMERSNDTIEIVSPRGGFRIEVNIP
jgi:hypothetical protein